MAESRIFEHVPEPLTVMDWRNPVGFTDVATMPVWIFRGHGAMTTMGRHQFDGNRPPRYRWPDGQTYDVGYAEPGLGECAVCHGVVRGRLHSLNE